MISIRNYNYFSDYRMLEAWLSHYDMEIPPSSFIPAESTFIAEYNGRPMVSSSVYYTNAKPMAYIENFIGNPHEKSKIRQECTKCLLQHIKTVSKEHGVSVLLAFPQNEKLESYYKNQLGIDQDMGIYSVLATRTD